MTPAEYDPLVPQYGRSKALPFRVYSEIPNHLESLGDVRGLAVLDLACGDGFYARLIRRAGAARVVGADISSEMIARARALEQQDPLGIEYVCSAAELVAGPAEFDVVSAAYLLNCAADRDSLDRMASAIARQLRPGGRFVATIGHLGGQPGVDYTRYGMATQIPAGLPEGAPYTIAFLLGAESFTITDYNHSLAAYEQALRSAELEPRGWLAPTVTAEGIQRLGADYWTTWLQSPCIWRVEARKPE